MITSRLRYSRAFLRVALCAVSLFGVGVRASAQDNASIIGQVFDESGGALPGVTVTAASASLQTKQVSAVTDDKGEYRLTLLPIGTYDVRYELTGFQAVRREGIRLTVGFVAKIDVSLKVGGVSESVTVSGVSPVVDVTTASTTTTFQREALEALPTTRNSLVSLTQQAPGLRTSAGSFDVGGSQFTNGPSFNNFGRTGDNWEMLDGVVTTSAAGSTEGVYWDFSTYEEAQIQTVGANAEVPGSGVYVNTVLKSGGNAFHGTGFYGFTGPWAQANNIDDALRARGVTGTNALLKRYDVSGDLGGRIILDKLWFYGNLRRAFDDASVIGVTKDDGSAGDFPKLQRFWTGKLRYRLSPTQSLTVMNQWNGKFNIRDTNLTGWESRLIQDQTGATRKAEWQGTFGSSVSASAMYGYWYYESPLSGGSPGKVGTYDLTTLKYTGDEFWLAGPGPVTVAQYRHQVKANLSWYKHDLLGGNHDFKIGLDYSPSIYHNTYGDRGPSQDYYLILRAGAPFELGTFNIPVDPLNRADYAGAFVQDNWSLGHVTLNLGVRYDRNHAYNPAQSRPAGPFAIAQSFPGTDFPTWNAFAPRIHAAWDVTGKGRTVIKGGWSRYDKMRFVGDVQAANLNALNVNVFRWHDLNGDGKYEPGEVDLNVNGADFVSNTAPPGVTALPSGGGSVVANPNESEPKIDEFTGSVEHELMSSLAIRLTTVFSREFDFRRLAGVSRPYSSYNIPISARDPGPDGVLNTADDPGQVLTYFEYPAALRGQALSITTPVNDPNFVNTYKAVELSAVKRLSGGWQMLGAIGSIWPNKVFAADLTAFTPNAEILSRDTARRWYFKFGGSYRIPRVDVQAAANLNGVSGEPFQRTVLVTGGNTIPSFSVPAEAIGAEHYPNAYLVDLRLEKMLRLPKQQKVSARVDLFNALNTNVVTTQTTQSGASFLKPSAIMPGRIGVFSLSYSF
jgi:hypothetical protein